MSEVSEKNIKILVKKIKKGDKEAFGEIYELFAERIFRYIYLKIGNKEEAEDLTQQVFVRAWESLDNFQFRKNPFSSWVYRIAHNLVVDFYRKKNDALSLNHDIEIEIIDSLDLDESLYYREESKKILRLINQLPTEQKDILILRFVSDLSYREIAKIMKKNPLTLRVLQHRALKKIRELINDNNNKF